MPSRLKIRDERLSLGTAATVNEILHTTGKSAEHTVLRVAYGCRTTQSFHDSSPCGAAAQRGPWPPHS